ncbi:MAG: 23S rRNA (adenine(2503)-C(2))-methyltransferase RlmN, partial [Eubacteriales bacterium]
EYAMIDGVSDRSEQATLLANKLQGMAAHVNLIPLNEVKESDLKTSTRQAVAKFQEILESKGVTATVRRSLGGDIDASCGQLRRNYENEHEEVIS